MKKITILLVLVMVLPLLAERLYWDDGSGASHRSNYYIAVNFRDIPGGGDTDDQPGVVTVVRTCLGDTWRSVDLYWAEDDDGVPGEIVELECTKSTDNFFWYTHKLTLDTPLSVPGNFWVILRVPSNARVYYDETISDHSTSYHIPSLDEPIDWTVWYYDWMLLVEWEADPDPGVEETTWGTIKASF